LLIPFLFWFHRKWTFRPFAHRVDYVPLNS
jgi:hypothetical protein